ncbi:MAG TPA: hypothetical protein VGM10_25450 [Actinocrinis sp.]|jgi:hypothetical protein
MWVRIVVGAVLSLVGLLWIAQGVGAAKGSMMSGHPVYAALGVIVLIGGLYLLYSVWRRRAGRVRESSGK